MKKSLSLLIFALVLTCSNGFAQHFSLEPELYHVFDADSLKGFDEDAARASAIAEDFVGKEFPIRMYQLKRNYINDKYNLWKPAPVSLPNYAQRSSVVPACVNEDFEASDAGTITASNQILGWTVTSGTNAGSGNNSCNLNGCCPSQPISSELIEAVSTGYVDPVIGNCYPIFSVFGDGPANTTAATVNTHIPIPMRGTKFIRINSHKTGDRSIEKLSKTFSVTPSNALFQFAFISVFSPGHGCCDAGAFKISLPGIPCPTFSASAPSSACTNTAAGVNFLSIPYTSSTVAPCSPYTGPSGVQYVFNRWQLSSMDLTAYIGQTVTIDIVASDCTAGGHFGTVYFDAQCGPMAILGNGTPFPAGSQNVTVPTCGPNGATICATPGLGPYSWAGPNIPTGYSTPSFTNQCFTTSVSATYTLYMNPPGGCAPFTRIVHTTVTPAPTIVGNVKQATCGDTVAVVTVTTGGSAGNPAHITWYPPPYSLSTQSTSADYIIPQVGSPTLVVTVSAADQIGCPITMTLGVNPPAPVPDFTVNNNSGTYTISCLTPSVDLQLTSNYTYGSKEYFWASSSFTSTQENVVLTNPGQYIVTITDPVSKCAKSKTISIGSNTVQPTSAISPTFQNITCTLTSITSVSASALSPQTNITHRFLSPLGGSFVTTAIDAYYPPGTPGTYTYQLVNNVNGCKSTKTFTVSSSQGFPTFSLTSAQNFSLGCNTRSVAEINIVGAQAEPGSPGAVSYSLLAPGASSTTAPGVLTPTSSYIVKVPGTYTVVTQNNANSCQTRLPISILSNTAPPGIDSIAYFTDILTCFTPSIYLRGISYAPNINYRWDLPQNLTQAGDSLEVLADFSKPTNTTLATYTLVVEDNSSTCISKQTIEISQNLFPPVPRVASSGSLTCVTPSIVLSNVSTWGANNPFPTPKGVNAIRWDGPSPQIPAENTSTYKGLMPGTYTMTAMDMNNGCTSTTTHAVPENRIYPVVNNPETPGPFPLDCGGAAAKVYPFVTSNTVGLVYTWSAPASATTSIKKGRVDTLLTNVTGDYFVIVTNTVNGCSSESSVMRVLSGSLTAEFEVDKPKGFAPHTVNLENFSTSSVNNQSITSIWVFGNNSTATLSSVSSTNTTYTQPGTYTITLFVKKGECVEKTQKVVVVDIPSQMVIPNVFTPNGDGVNDLFFLQRSSNLSQISAVIYDRWGNKVYEVDSSTGQIEWDGTNMFGKEVPTGTYYYIITATGRDGEEYDEKGSISLLR